MRHVHDPRTRPVPPQLIDAARRLLDSRGPIGASRELGISRNALLGALATGRAMPGTIAMMERSGAHQSTT